MATVTNTIALNDKMSGKLKTINKALAQTLQHIERLQRAPSLTNLSSGLSSVNNATRRTITGFSNLSTTAQRGMQGVYTAVSRTTRAINNTPIAINRTNTSLGSLTRGMNSFVRQQRDMTGQFGRALTRMEERSARFNQQIQNQNTRTNQQYQRMQQQMLQSNQRTQQAILQQNIRAQQQSNRANQQYQRMQQMTHQQTLRMQQSLQQQSSRADQQYQRMQQGNQRAAERMQQQTDRLNQRMQQLSESSRRVGSSFGGWQQGLTTIATMLYITQSLIGAFSSFTDITDSFIMSTARLNLMNDGLQTTRELQGDVFDAAQRSRMSYADTSKTVAKLGILAEESFSSSKEVVRFSELMNKSFKIGGASIQEQTAGMYQLTQAMAAGKLQGDEFRSIMENAPLLAGAIAKFTGVSKGQLKILSGEGLITADIIKGALFTAGKDIEKNFKSIPKTFGDAWVDIKNRTLMAFEPIHIALSRLVNSQRFRDFADSVVNNIQWIVYSMIDMARTVRDAYEYMTSTEEFQQFASTVSSIVTTTSAVIKDIANSTVEVTKKMIEVFSIINDVIQTHKVAISMAIIGISILLSGIFYTAIMGAITPLGILATKLLMTAFGFMLNNLWLIEMVLLVGIAMWAWYNLGETGKVLAVVLISVAVAIGIWEAAQWLLNSALTSNPIGAVILVIIGLIVIVGALIYWIYDLWQTNMEFKYGFLAIWDSICLFYSTLPARFQQVAYGIVDAFYYCKSQVLSVFESIYNGCLGFINKIIDGLNKIPGVEIKHAGKSSMGADAKKEASAVYSKTLKKQQDVQREIDAKYKNKAIERNVQRSEDVQQLTLDKGKAAKDKKENDFASSIQSQYNSLFSKMPGGIGPVTPAGYGQPPVPGGIGPTAPIGYVPPAMAKIPEAMPDYEITPDVANQLKEIKDAVGKAEEKKKEKKAKKPKKSEAQKAAEKAERERKKAERQKIAAQKKAERERKKAEREAAKKQKQLDEINRKAGGIQEGIFKLNQGITLSDEDIRMLRDVAVMEAQYNYTKLTPNLQVTFGDVKETADVKQIMKALEDMIEKSYANSLVGV
jgi:tape measure domain-containing protein